MLIQPGLVMDMRNDGMTLHQAVAASASAFKK
jgi:hypothetical protein